MATLEIFEFAGVGDGNLAGRIPQAPLLNDKALRQTVTSVNSTSKKSAALAATTHLVVLKADADCMVAAGDTTATASAVLGPVILADTEYHYTVEPGDYIAVRTVA